MSVIQALLMGLIQGITEFLPISSSAHLIIFRHFMKIEDTQIVFFNVLLHFGSMIAILLTFSREWKRLFLALCGIVIDLFHNLKEHFSNQHQERKQYRKVLGSNYRMLAFLLILTTIPTAIIRCRSVSDGYSACRCRYATGGRKNTEEPETERRSDCRIFPGIFHDSGTFPSRLHSFCVCDRRHDPFLRGQIFTDRERPGDSRGHDR